MIRREALRPLARLEQQLRDKPLFTTVLLKAPEAYRKLVDPYDVRQPLEARARSYLHANCTQCHVDAGGGNAQIDLEFTTKRERMRMFDVPPLHDTFGVAGAEIVRPGEPERSTLYLRMQRRGPDRCRRWLPLSWIGPRCACCTTGSRG